MKTPSCRERFGLVAVVLAGSLAHSIKAQTHLEQASTALDIATIGTMPNLPVDRHPWKFVKPSPIGNVRPTYTFHIENLPPQLNRFEPQNSLLATPLGAEEPGKWLRDIGDEIGPRIIGKGLWRSFSLKEGGKFELNNKGPIRFKFGGNRKFFPMPPAYPPSSPFP